MAGTRKKAGATGTRGTATKGGAVTKRGVAAKPGVAAKRGVTTKGVANKKHAPPVKRAAKSVAESESSKPPALTPAALRTRLAQRETELALINSIQHGLAAKLDFQAIVDLVGDKLREVFNTGDIGIVWHDPRTNRLLPLYVYEHGVRLRGLPPGVPVPDGPWAQMSQTRRPLVVNSRSDMAALGLTTVPGTDTSLSVVRLPILGTNRVLGSIDIENFEREHAFGDAEIRLLGTVAGSLGAALENARLFDETQRLLKETEQRAAELAVINSIQQGVAAELDFQAIIDLVGDKLREVLKTDEIGIRWFDHNQRLIHHMYEFEHGVRLTIPSAPPRSSTWDELTSRRVPLLINTAAEIATKGVLPGTDMSKSLVQVPIVGSDRVIGGIIVENYEREHAFSRVGHPAAVDGRVKHGRCARERASLRRDAAAVEGDRAAQRRARGDQQHPAGDGQIAGFPRHRRPGGR